MSLIHLSIRRPTSLLVGALLATAGAAYAVEKALEYGESREAFGRPIIKFQVWRHKFVEHLAAVEADVPDPAAPLLALGRIAVSLAVEVTHGRSLVVQVRPQVRHGQ